MNINDIPLPPTPPKKPFQFTATHKNPSEILNNDKTERKSLDENVFPNRKRHKNEQKEKKSKRLKKSEASPNDQSIDRSIANNNNAKVGFLKSQVIVKYPLKITKSNEKIDKVNENQSIKIVERNNIEIIKTVEENDLEKLEGKSIINEELIDGNKNNGNKSSIADSQSELSPQLSSSSSSATEKDNHKNRSIIAMDRNSVATATALANDCLKQLSITINQINIVYQNACSKIPCKKTSPNVCLKLSNIPLPPDQPGTNKKNLKNLVGPKTPELLCDNNNKNHQPKLNYENQKTDSIMKEVPVNINKRQSNSINIDNLSHISNSSFDSKNGKSPFYSLNVSSHSKESESGDSKLRPLIPKISNFTINYTTIGQSFFPEIFLKNRTKFFMEDMKCFCTMPNPDAWNEGVRSCSNGQNCLLAQLKIQCDSTICPTECLCCNTEFTGLENSLHKMNNIEFFFDIYQSVPWKIRAKKPIEKNRLIFEVAGFAESNPDNFSSNNDQPSLYITKHLQIHTKKDAHSYMYYMNYGTQEQANVKLEKWLVNGEIRVGVFAVKNIEAREELIVFFPNNRLNVFYEEPNSINDETEVLSCLQYLLHEPISIESVLRILSNILSSEHRRVILEYFRDLGGPAIFCRLCDSFFEKEAFCIDLFEKLFDIMISVPYRNRNDTELLGVNLQNFSNSLSERIKALLPHTNQQLDQLTILRNRLTVAVDINRESVKDLGVKYMQKVNVSSNSDILHCRLPPYWLSKQCIYNNEYRVFFYHRLTKVMQWDMPVYPWEANDNNDIEIYDYNLASQNPVTHDEIQQMYINLNKIYEMKQKKMLSTGNILKRKKETQDNQKKESFRKKITVFITNLLKPYRQSGCTEGKIESDEDLQYLTNKLSQTILCKELKILNSKCDHLEVSAQVEMKTKAYVRAYMQSRGITYKRPVHHLTAADHKTGTGRPPALLKM